MGSNERLAEAEAEFNAVGRTNYALSMMRSPPEGVLTPQRVEQARKLLEETVALHPHHAEAWCALGVARSMQQDDAALSCWQRALELRPNYAEVYGNIGAHYAYNGDLPTAIENFQRGVAIQPDTPPVWINLCIAYARNGQLEQAEEAFQVARALAPTHAQLWRCAHHLGRRIEAAELRLESTRLRIEMLKHTPVEVTEQIPDANWLDLW